MTANFDIHTVTKGKAETEKPRLSAVPSAVKDNFLALMTRAILPSLPGVKTDDPSPVEDPGFPQENAKDNLNPEGDAARTLSVQALPLPQPQLPLVETAASPERSKISMVPNGPPDDGRKARNLTMAPKADFPRTRQDFSPLNPARHLKFSEFNSPVQNRLGGESNRPVPASGFFSVLKKKPGAKPHENEEKPAINSEADGRLSLNFSNEAKFLGNIHEPSGTTGVSSDKTQSLIEQVEIPFQQEKLLSGETKSSPGEIPSSSDKPEPPSQKIEPSSEQNGLSDKAGASSDKIQPSTAGSAEVSEKNSVSHSIALGPDFVMLEKPIQAGEQKRDATVVSETQSSPLLDGKKAAKQESSMRFAEEQNKFAESALQKLPHFGRRPETAAVEAGKMDAKSIFVQPGQKEKSLLESSQVNNFVSLDGADSGKNLLNSATQVPERAPVQVDRIARWAATEVFAFKQTGANAVTVSLKLGAQTEISLGLTHRDGQIQATIQCERGDFSEAGNHWGQLQESLARHNVQLMPLQQTNSPRTSAPDVLSNNLPDSGHPRQRQNREQPMFSTDSLLPVATLETGKFAKTKNATGRTRWESWA